MRTPPIFVIGCPRSGTTLLSELLGPTSWGAPVETHFITKYAHRLSRYGNLEDDSNLRRLVGDIIAERPVQQWGIDFDLDELIATLPDRTYATIVDHICMQRFAHLGKESWGDKTPHYILDLETLYRLFPDSRYIYIVRDGRDVALSLLRMPWGPQNVFACADYWRRCNEPSPVLDEMRQEGRLLDIRYETLIDDAERSIRAVLDFLEQPQDAEQIERIIAPVRPGNHTKWKAGMSPGQRRIFEAVAGDTLRRFDYETEYADATVSAFGRSLWAAHDKMLNLAHLVKMNTVDAIRIRYFGMQPFAE